MNTSKLLKWIYCGSALLLCALAACDSSDSPINREDPINVDRPDDLASIEDIMRLHYFWYTEIPASSKLNYTLSPTDFFNSLLSSKDGKNGSHYSRIEPYSDTKSRAIWSPDYSYGFEFSTLRFGIGGYYYAPVHYVLPNSPAESAGLKRGDWITAIDGKPITTKEDYNKLYGDVAHEFTIKRFEAGKYVTPANNIIKMPAARAVEDIPVFMVKTLTTPKGKKTGYLVYNRFAAGPNEDDNKDTKYEDDLREASRILKAADVQELVIDLRYNQGGLLSSAILLSCIIAPKTVLDQQKTLCAMRFNDKNKKDNYTYKFGIPWLTNNTTNAVGNNLNLKRVYILTSYRTASASELIINCLRPYYRVYLIGDKTEGKNVGSITYKTSDNKWKLHPIVSQIFNCEDKSDYVNGFMPDYMMDEFYEFDAQGYVIEQDIFPLGDPKERLLSMALKHIDNGTFTKASDTRSEGLDAPKNIKMPFSSLDRKATYGVIINQ